MANQSIKDAFQRFWEHVIVKTNELKTYVDNSIVKYNLEKNDTTITLIGSDGSTTSVEETLTVASDDGAGNVVLETTNGMTVAMASIDGNGSSSKTLVGEITLDSTNISAVEGTEGVYNLNDDLKTTMDSILQQLDEGFDILMVETTLTYVSTNTTTEFSATANYTKNEQSDDGIGHGISFIYSQKAYTEEIGQYDFLQNYLRTNEIDRIADVLDGSATFNVKFYTIKVGGSVNSSSNDSCTSGKELIGEITFDSTNVIATNTSGTYEPNDELKATLTDIFNTLDKGYDVLVAEYMDSNGYKMNFNCTYANGEVYGFKYIGMISSSGGANSNIISMSIYSDSICVNENISFDPIFSYDTTMTFKFYTIKVGGGNNSDSGTQIQADYAENDSTKPNYIKNRPLSIKNEVIFDEDITTVFSEADNGNIAELTTTIFDELETGDNFNIVFDGTSYSCSVGLSNLFGSDMYYVGNISILGISAYGITREEIDDFIAENPAAASLLDDTGEPFVFCIIPALFIMFLTEEAGTYNVKIVDSVPIVDDKFKTLFQCDYNQNDPKAYGYIKNRPFYESVETIYEGNLTATKDDDDKYGSAFAPVGNFARLNAGDKVNVVWDGVNYSLTCETLADYITIGNPKVMIGNYSDGEVPFYIHIVSGSGVLFYTLEGKSYSVNVTAEIIQKFSSKFIDWEDGEAPNGLPTVTSSNNGQLLGVVNGTWTATDAPSSLPTVTTDDDDKVLMVVNGVWTASSIADGDEVSY